MAGRSSPIWRQASRCFFQPRLRVRARPGVPSPAPDVRLDGEGETAAALRHLEEHLVAAGGERDLHLVLAGLQAAHHVVGEDAPAADEDREPVVAAEREVQHRGAIGLERHAGVGHHVGGAGKRAPRSIWPSVSGALVHATDAASFSGGCAVSKLSSG